MTAVNVEMFELKESDIAPEFPDAEPATPDDAAPLACGDPGCTNGITKPARGRTPKYCDDHKGGKANRNPPSATSGKGWREAREIEALLNQYVIGIGTGVTFVNKFDGEVIVTSGPAVVHELVELAKSDKNLQKYLTWLATPGKYGPLLLALGGVAIPILANHDVLPKFSLPTND